MRNWNWPNGSEWNWNWPHVWHELKWHSDLILYTDIVLHLSTVLSVQVYEMFKWGAASVTRYIAHNMHSRFMKCLTWGQKAYCLLKVLKNVLIVSDPDIDYACATKLTSSRMTWRLVFTTHVFVDWLIFLGVQPIINTWVNLEKNYVQKVYHTIYSYWSC
jgi:hypothetical protein